MKKITEGEWFPCEYGGYWFVQDKSNYGGRNILNEENFPEAQVNAEAMVTAVNNTYKKGINPEAVEDMKDALIQAKDELERFLLSYDIDTELSPIVKKINTALKKAGAL